MVTVDHLLSLLYNHRLLTVKQLCALSRDTSPQNTYKKIKRMMGNGLIKSRLVTLPATRAGNHNVLMCFFLTEIGLDQATEYLQIPFNVYDSETKAFIEKHHYEIRELRVAKSQVIHHLKVQDFLADFSDTINNSQPDRLKGVYWSEARRVHEFSHTDLNSYRPDWVIRYPGQNILVNLEMDMGTMNRKQIALKFSRFKHWLTSDEDNEKKYMLFALANQKNNTRLTNIKKIAYTELQDFPIDQCEIIVGDMETCLQWMKDLTLEKNSSQHNSLLLDCMKKQYPDVEIEHCDYGIVGNEYRERNIAFDHLYVVKSPNRKKPLFIHQFNRNTISTNMELSIHQNFDPRSNLFFFIFNSKKEMEKQVFVLEHENILATDIQTLNEKGLSNVFAWTNGGWKRKELSI